MDLGKLLQAIPGDLPHLAGWVLPPGLQTGSSVGATAETQDMAGIGSHPGIFVIGQ